MIDDTQPARRFVDPGPRSRLALAVAEAVDAVVGVRRTPGPGVEVATQFPGGKVVGISFSDTVQVHLVVGVLPLDAVTDQVHLAVRYVLDLVNDRREVIVTVDDIDVTALSSGRLG